MPIGFTYHDDCCGHAWQHDFHGHWEVWHCWGHIPWGFGFPFRRRFVTKEERIAWLEEYLKNLQAEVKAVEERIAELKRST